MKAIGRKDGLGIYMWIDLVLRRGLGGEGLFCRSTDSRRRCWTVQSNYACVRITLYCFLLIEDVSP